MGQRGGGNLGPGSAAGRWAPRSAALLAIVLAYLVVAGVFMAIVFPDEGSGLMVFRIAYAASATAAAIGLWRQHRWAGFALVAWVGVALLCASLLAQPLDTDSPLRQATFVAAFAGILWLLYRYVKRSSPTQDGESSP